MSDQKAFLDKFSPKTNYFLGLGSGIVGLLIIGFFVLLFMFIRGEQGAFDNLAGSGGSAQAVAQAEPKTGDTAAQPVVLAEVTSDDHIRGSFAAPITVIEYSDFECPFCRQFHPTLIRLLDEYGEDQIRWVYRHFPLSSIHPQAQPAAEAAECAAEQGGNEAFWTYGDALFENQSQLSKDLYISLAGELNLNISNFTKCLDDGKYQDKVQQDYQSGIAAGVRGTPGSFINGQSVPGALPYEQVKAVVDSLLQ